MKLWGGNLSAGASLGAIREQINLAELSIRDQDDLVPAIDNRSYTMPVAEVAVIFNTTRYWVGTEWTRLNRSKTQWASGGTARMYYHGNTTAGVMIPAGKDDLIKLSGIVRYTEGGFWNYDIAAGFLLNNLIWFGSGYRAESGPLFFTEVNINPKLRLGYSYETGNNQTYLPAQGHEIFLGFNPGNQQRSSIRFFQ
jgi:type IX secretion system PorP/SprF family membrane protein